MAFPENLRTAVRRLREALSDDAEVPRYVENLRDRGYRFICPVEIEPIARAEPEPPRSIQEFVVGPACNDSVAQGLSEERTGTAAKNRNQSGIGEILEWLLSHRRELVLAAFFTAFLLIFASHFENEDVVAVLPFAADASAKALAEGMAENIAVRLAQCTPKSGSFRPRRIAVIPHDQVRAHHIRDAAQASRELGANLVVKGKLDRSSGNERVFLSVVQPATGHIVCAEMLTDITDPIAVEERIADFSSKCLNLEPKSTHRSEASFSPPPAAYRTYLEGRGYLHAYDMPDSVDRAVGAFSKAVDLDHSFALAYAGLGEAYWKKFEALKNPALAGLAQQSCDQALHLDNRLAEAQVCIGTLHLGSGEYRKATEDFYRAVQLDPRQDEAWRGLARAHSELGDLTQAENEYLKAIAVRPYWGNYVELAAFYFYHARYEDAEAQFRKAIHQSPDNSELYRGLGGVYIACGRYHDAVRSLREAIALHPTSGSYENLGTAYLALGRVDDATVAYRRALDLQRTDHRAYGNLARALYWSGKPEQARVPYQEAVNLAQQELTVNPKEPNVHIDLAWYCAMLGQQAEARNHLVSAQALESEKAEFAFIAAIVHNQFGERAAAFACLRRARELGFSPIEIVAAPSGRRYPVRMVLD